jgi:CheY-like chemotaxis protein
MGLAVVHGIARQLGGWAEADSGPEGGAVIRLCLPAESSAEEEDAGEEAGGAEGERGGKVILLVEPDAAVREFLAGVLQSSGFDVLAAGTAAEALQACDRAGRRDLLLSDVGLPDKSGSELAEDLLARDPNIRVLLTRGSGDAPRTRERVTERGPHSLRKPYSVSELLTTVRRILGSGEATPCRG